MLQMLHWTTRFADKYFFQTNKFGLIQSKSQMSQFGVQSNNTYQVVDRSNPSGLSLITSDLGRLHPLGVTMVGAEAIPRMLTE